MLGEGRKGVEVKEVVVVGGGRGVVRGFRYEYLTTKAVTPKTYNHYSQHVHNIVWKMAALILIHINVKLYIHMYMLLQPQPFH